MNIHAELRHINPAHHEGHELKTVRGWVHCPDCPDPMPQIVDFRYEWQTEHGLCACAFHKCDDNAIDGTALCQKCNRGDCYGY